MKYLLLIMILASCGILPSATIESFEKDYLAERSDSDFSIFFYDAFHNRFALHRSWEFTDAALAEMNGELSRRGFTPADMMDAYEGVLRVGQNGLIPFMRYGTPDGDRSTTGTFGIVRTITWYGADYGTMGTLIVTLLNGKVARWTLG